ncbi:phosphoglycerate mutase family domain protein [Metarhizium album ARSEF 1941]|uniref:Phosphoglycerate mutase family domain protein n=1 Tax=Metarhizium album (strain ARSEF 1941) TaxID=1081103 RepID=A0A0B2X9B9_METAS|nr:phosphoglycerate mutase family domain protein [Metarhizium album ARSEF 1941]KHO01906.1 phosphoglycerate mutase family domain protein [Metarhizium album ARSEF 1941]
MAKPRLIILIRHGQSEGNKNREIHQSVPDHRVKLTPEGWSQAHEAGRRLRNLLRPDDTVQVFTSPYRRTRETTDGILATLTSDDPDISPFRRSNIKVYEEPRLREQDFGNFQPCSAEMERMWQERLDYGHFFYRIPNGESAADAYDRVSGFNESLWRQFGDEDFASVFTHGLMSRVFLMKWYHLTVEEFEDLRNLDHCEFLVMRKQENGKFLLETKLRTWSELRRERALANVASSGSSSTKEKGKDETPRLDRERTFVVTRKWGGCPNGCNHTDHYKRRHDLEALRQRDNELSAAANGTSTMLSARRHRHKSTVSVGDGDDEHSDQQAPGGARLEQTRSLDDTAPSPDGTSSYAQPYDGLRSLSSPRLHLGRDFGGTYSGHASVAGSDSEASSGQGRCRRSRRRKTTHQGKAHAATKCVGACANRLGDAAPAPGSDTEDLDAAEKKDRSISWSVY